MTDVEIVIVVAAVFLGALVGLVATAIFVVRSTLVYVWRYAAFRQIRLIHRLPDNVVVSAFVLPLISAVGAISAGGGISLLTAAEENSNPVLGLGLILLGLGALAVMSFTVLKEMTKHRALRNIRERLSQAERMCRSNNLDAHGLKSLHTELSRIARIGRILVGRARDMAFLSWVRANRNRTLLLSSATCQIFVVVAAVMTAFAMVSGKFQPPNAQKNSPFLPDDYAVAVLGVLIGVLVAFLLSVPASWYYYRKLCHTLGSEFTERSRRVLAHRLFAAHWPEDQTPDMIDTVASGQEELGNAPESACATSEITPSSAIHP